MSDLTLPLAEIKKWLSVVDGVEERHDREALVENDSVVAAGSRRPDVYRGR